MKNEEYTTIKLNGALVTEIEEFLKTHPEHGTTFEEFVADAGRRRQEQLSAAALAEQPASTKSPQDYSEHAVQGGLDALNKTGPPQTSEEKQKLMKDLAACYRNLKTSGRGGETQ